MSANDSKKKSRRNFVRSAIVGLGTIPLASLDTKASFKAPQEDIRQTSPILVGGGGSVGIDFDEGWYPFDPVTKRFFNKDDTLHKLWLVDKYGSRQDITPHEDCTVTINCGKSSGKTYYVTIFGKPLGIEFDTSHFQLGYPPGGVKKIHYHLKRKISKITVHDNVAQTNTEYEPPTKGKCSIIVVDKL